MNSKKHGNEINMNSRDLEKFRNDSRRWISSDDGKNSIKEALEKASKVTKKFREATGVDKDVLKTPITL